MRKYDNYIIKTTKTTVALTKYIRDYYEKQFKALMRPFWKTINGQPDAITGAKNIRDYILKCRDESLKYMPKACFAGKIVNFICTELPGDFALDFSEAYKVAHLCSPPPEPSSESLAPGEFTCVEVNAVIVDSDNVLLEREPTYGFFESTTNPNMTGYFKQAGSYTSTKNIPILNIFWMRYVESTGFHFELDPDWLNANNISAEEIQIFVLAPSYLDLYEYVGTLDLFENGGYSHNDNWIWQYFSEIGFWNPVKFIIRRRFTLSDNSEDLPDRLYNTTWGMRCDGSFALTVS